MKTMNGTRPCNLKATQAKAFVYWAKRYRQETMIMSFEAFGNYLASFIKYLLRDYGNLLTEKDREKCGDRLKGKLTEMVRGFEQEERYSERSMNEAWRKFFMLFCLTGDVESDFDVFSYLNTGDVHLLPKQAWVRKEVPFSKSSGIQSSSEEVHLKARVEALEKQLSVLLGGRKDMSEPENTFSSLLSEYVRNEVSDRAVTRDSVLIGLVGRMNEQGGHFMRPELEFILDRTHEMFVFGRIKTIVKRISELEILLKEDGQPYSASELLALPLGFQLIQEDRQVQPRR